MQKANTGTVNGKVIKMLDTQQISEKFSKREIIIETPEPYSQLLAVQFVNDNIDRLERITTGSYVNIEVNLKGREWVNPQGETKYFGNLEGWKIATENPEVDTRKNEDIVGQQNADAAKEGDDLPF